MIRADQLSVCFGRGSGAVTVLTAASISLLPGQRLGLAGPSGSGKSTLARVLALMLAPQAGTVSVDGMAVPRFGLRAPAGLRRRVALLWQSPRLATDPRFTLHQVISEPLLLEATRPSAAQRRTAVHTEAHAAGLTPDLLDRRPFEVSEGQLQRACLARALITRPRYLICDEPTSMLDVSTQAAVLDLIEQRRREDAIGILLISHDRTLLAHWCDRVLEITDLSRPGDRAA